jgi:SsrA-binding protein
VKEKGYTLIPVKVYLKQGLVKVELALARGKRLYDKRRDIAERDQRREVERGLKEKDAKQLKALKLPFSDGV